MDSQIEIIQAQSDAQIRVIQEQNKAETARMRQECLRMAQQAIIENRSIKLHTEAEDVTAAAVIAYAQELEAYVSGDSDAG